MIWIARIGTAYFFFMLLGLGAIGFLARADRARTWILASNDGLYRFIVYRDVPIPAFLGGRGRAPGEVEIQDNSGRVVDTEHYDDVTSIRAIRWERFKVGFLYLRDGREYATSLNLPQ